MGQEKTQGHCRVWWRAHRDNQEQNSTLPISAHVNFFKFIGFLASVSSLIIGSVNWESFSFGVIGGSVNYQYWYELTTAAYLASGMSLCWCFLPSGMAGFRDSECVITVLFLSIAQLCSQHLEESLAHDRCSITIDWNREEWMDGCFSEGTLSCWTQNPLQCVPQVVLSSQNWHSRWSLFTMWLQRKPSLHCLCRAYVFWKGIVSTSTVVDFLWRRLSIGPPFSLCTSCFFHLEMESVSPYPCTWAGLSWVLTNGIWQQWLCAQNGPLTGLRASFICSEPASMLLGSPSYPFGERVHVDEPWKRKRKRTEAPQLTARSSAQTFERTSKPSQLSSRGTLMSDIGGTDGSGRTTSGNTGHENSTLWLF